MGVSRRRLLTGIAGTIVAGTGAAVLTAHDPTVRVAGTATAQPGGARPKPEPVPTKPAFRVRDLRPDAPHDAIALTIDDGPDPQWTPQVLDLLERLQIQATFSLVGSSAHTHPALVRRIVASGHGVCNHTMNHPEPFAGRSRSAVLREITDAQHAIVTAGGRAPRLFRSPGGDWSPEVFRAVAGYGMRPIDWNVDPRDWARPGTGSITRKMLAATPGDIVLCHDGGGNRAQTLAALSTVLPRWKARGYTFVSL